jgi:WASH complex subunit strumpellin
MKSISMIHRCIGVSGLNGLDRLLCYNIISKMRYILKLIPREVDSQTKKILGDSFNELKSITSFVDKYEKVYTNLKRM